ncbi:hypothetical protein VTN49DRAFT_6554 [Thermomyces lanuginosus]|uniref:uncharacterized protein n=1 Tax=Thermomyces lanuginosus TaxID=5541 RepID=UPI00374284A3
MVNTMETNHGLPSPFSSSVGIAQVTQPPSLPTCPVTALFDPGTLDGRALGQPLPLCLPGRIGSQGSLQATLFLFPRGADMVAFVPWSDCLTRFPAGKCCEGPWTAAANQPPATAVPCAGSQLSNRARSNGPAPMANNSSDSTQPRGPRPASKRPERLTRREGFPLCLAAAAWGGDTLDGWTARRWHDGRLCALLVLAA